MRYKQPDSSRYYLTAIFLLSFFGVSSAFSQELEEQNYEQFQGLTISKITIIVKDIFDLDKRDENRWLFRKANQLQVNTRPRVVRKQLLFNEGEPLDSDLLQETRRKLEQRSYIIEADIYVSQIDEISVEVEVVIRDAWVMEPRVSYSRSGGQDTSEFGILDGNFLGSGDSISLTYATEQDRNSVSYAYTARNLFDKWIDLKVIKEDTSDGVNQTLSLERPFYALQSKYAWGGHTNELRQNYVIRERGETVESFRASEDFSEVYFGTALSSDHESTYRLTGGVTKSTIHFNESEETLSQLPDDVDRQYWWVQSQFIENEFSVYKNLELINRRENLNLGNTFTFRMGAGEDQERGGQSIYHLSGRAATRKSSGESSLAVLRANFTGFYYQDSEELLSSHASFSAEFHYFISEKQRWYTRFEWKQGFNLQRYELFELGGQENLRGYPLQFQSGQRLVSANVERRAYFQKEFLNLFYAGAVAFMDFGQVAEYKTFSDGSLLADAGFGLRIMPSRVGNAIVIHLDLARPLVDNDGIDSYYLTFGAQARF